MIKSLLIGIISLLSFTNGRYFTTSNFLEENPLYQFSRDIFASSNPYQEPYYLNEEQYQYQHLDLGDSWSTSLGEGVKIAIIDTGIRYDHHDFYDEDGCSIISEDSASIMRVASPNGGTYIEIKTVKEEGYKILMEDTTNSSNNHATAVTGTIASAVNNKLGVGLAPKAEIINIKLGDLQNLELYAALEYAQSLDVDIINMSFALYESDYPGIAKSLKPYIDACYNQGITMVASSGNDQTYIPSYPAAYDNVIAVGALKDNSSNEIAEYSNFSYNDIVAPGTVYVPWIDYGSVYTLDDYHYVSGTSFAAPLTSAALALYKAKYPHATCDQMKEALLNSAIDLGLEGYDYDFGYGRLSVANLLNYPPLESVSYYDEIKIPLSVETYQIVLETNPSDILLKNITFTSTNEMVASVNNQGLLSLKALGKTTINYQSNVNPNIFGSFTLEVIDENINLDLDNTKTNYTFGENISPSDIKFLDDYLPSDLTIKGDTKSLGEYAIKIVIAGYEIPLNIKVTNLNAEITNFMPIEQAKAYYEYFMKYSGEQCQNHYDNFSNQVWEELNAEYDYMLSKSKEELLSLENFEELNQRYTLIVNKYNYNAFIEDINNQNLLKPLDNNSKGILLITIVLLGVISVFLIGLLYIIFKVKKPKNRK